MKRIVMIMMAVVGFGQLAQAQLRTYTSNEEDSMACVQNLSLYIEYFKQDNFKDAYPGWTKAASICPKSTESLWINGIKLVSELIDIEENAERKSRLIDTLFWAYDQRIEHFGKEGYVLGRKGSDMLKYLDDPKPAFETLDKSFELQGNEMEAGASIYYYKAAYDMYRKKQTDKALLIEVYDKLSDAVDYNIANQSDERMKTAYSTALANINKMFVTVADCPDLIENFTPKFEANPSDEALLRKILKALEKRDCTEEQLYLDAAEALFKISPDATAAYAIANGYAKKDNLSKAYEYYMNSADQAEDDAMKTKSLTKAANTALILGNYIKAKALAQQLLAMNPNNGEAYIIIGNAYVKGRKDCGSNECESRAAFWAAVDMFQKAKAVDGSVAGDAQKLINTYSAQFPKKEDCFFHGINEGTTYTFDCWIGGTTTVRTRDN